MKKIVITNHTDKFVEWYDLLIKHGYTRDDVIIYDREHPGFNGSGLDPKRFDKYGSVIRTPNVGYNIYVIGKFVVDNYENLPDYTLFIKCNILQNLHTTQKIFEDALDANYFYPIEADPIHHKYTTPFTINDRIYVERVNPEIRTDTKVYPRLKNFPEFIQDLFAIDKIPDYLTFAPGANYVVPKKYLLKYSKNFYKKMMDYTDYHHSDVPEAHWFERILSMAWQGTLKENMSYIV